MRKFLIITLIIFLNFNFNNFVVKAEISDYQINKERDCGCNNKEDENQIANMANINDEVEQCNNNENDEVDNMADEKISKIILF